MSLLTKSWHQMIIFLCLGMKTFLLVLVILWIGSQVEGKSAQEKITVFTSDDLEEAIETSIDMVLLICNHEQMYLCKLAIPQLTHTKGELKGKKEVVIGVLDFLEEYEHESNKPDFLDSTKDGMMLYYQNGKLAYRLQFVPPYNSISIVNWIERVGSRSLQLLDANNLNELQTECDGDSKFMVLYDLDDKSSLSDTVTEVCKLFIDSIRCVAVRDTEMIENVFGSDYRQRVVAYTCPGNVEQDVDIALFENEDLSLAEMKQQLEKELFSNFGKMSNVLLARGIHEYGVTVMVGISDEEDLPMLEEFAKEIDNAQIVWDLGSLLIPGFRGAGATGFVWPTAVAIGKDLKPISFNEELPFSLKNIKAFISGFLEGNYPTFMRSDPTPSYLESEPHEIRELVFKNFEIVEEDPSVPSLVYFNHGASGSNGYFVSAKELFESLPSYYDYYERDIFLYDYDIIRNFPPSVFSHAPQFILFYQGEALLYDGVVSLRPFTQWINSHCFPVLHDEL